MKTILKDIQIVKDTVKYLDEDSVYNGDIFSEEVSIIYSALGQMEQKAQSKLTEQYLRDFYKGVNNG